MVYLFLANGCEEIEALTPVDVLRRAGVEVLTVGVGGRSITSSHGITIEADVIDRDVELSGAVEGVILPGGMPGTINLGSSEIVKKTLAYCEENNLPIAAICAAPTVLKENGYLDNHIGTVYPTFTDKLGTSYVDKDVVIDGNIITGRGMGVSLEFSLAVLAVLRGSEVSDSIKNAVCYARSF